MWDGHLGLIKSTEHRIQLEKDAIPAYQQPYRAGPKQRELEKAEIDKMLSLDVIEPANSEWAAPIVFAPKKCGALRFCIDYRRLNAVTLRDSYPIPRMDECIDSLGQANIFSSLDCNSGYWQIAMSEEDKKKTAFTSHFGIFQFLRMPFGLKNAPMTFQRAIDIILAPFKWQSVMVYLDDVIVFSNNADQHLEDLTAVLRLLHNAGMTIKFNKCFFMHETIEYLGHVIRPSELRVADKTVAAVKQMKLPETKTQVRSFLGMCNVYRRFVPKFAEIASPLTALLRKEKYQTHLPTLDDKQVKSFENLKAALISPPVLTLPRADRHYVLDTDANAKQLGAVLQQRDDDGKLHPIGYFSRTLTDTEKNYDAEERECLGIIWAVTLLQAYIQGDRFTLTNG